MPEPAYKKHLSILKDAVYILGLVIALGGWIRSETKSKVVLETTVKSNTETLNKVDKFMDEQLVLNGQFIKFMEMDIHD